MWKTLDSKLPRALELRCGQRRGPRRSVTTLHERNGPGRLARPLRRCPKNAGHMRCSEQWFFSRSDRPPGCRKRGAFKSSKRLHCFCGFEGPLSENAMFSRCWAQEMPTCWCWLFPSITGNKGRPSTYRQFTPLTLGVIWRPFPGRAC